jgi:4-amino-4-deoxy-L-arabinose transferase-like glycosyltransferase
MKTWDHKKVFITLLIAWFLVNLLQSIFTEVLSDEAYYYLYGKYLAWGYFDHPPMVALLIKISSFFFDGNLGIRLMTVILQLGTLLLIWRIISVKEPGPTHVFLFFIIANSLVMFTAYGFFTTPDAPLLFFTALFLYAYKKYLGEQSWQTVIILSISMAGLVYSKYQAVLVIGFVVLSNPRLLKMYKFWLAGIVAILLLSPHIYWQIANEFPSFKYHLVDRSADFRWLYFFEYFPNQMAVFNPFTLGAVIYVLIKYRYEDLFTKALYFLIIGFIGFFWLTSFRGHVEPHWTVACSIPMIIILVNRISESSVLKKYVRRYILPSLLVLFLIRISFFTDLQLVRRFDFTGKKETITYIKSITKDLPVVFLTSFQAPSLFNYFTGKDAFALSNLNIRHTQYDIWQLEKKYQNKPVFVIGNVKGRSKFYEVGINNTAGFKTDSLQTTNRMKIVFEKPPEPVRSGDTVSILFTLNNPCEYKIDFNHSQFPVRVCTVIKGKETYFQPASLSEPIGILQRGESVTRTLKSVMPDLPSGTYLFGISLETILGPTLNSLFVKIKIDDHD